MPRVYISVNGGHGEIECRYGEASFSTRTSANSDWSYQNFSFVFYPDSGYTIDSVYHYVPGVDSYTYTIDELSYSSNYGGYYFNTSSTGADGMECEVTFTRDNSGGGGGSDDDDDDDIEYWGYESSAVGTYSDSATITNVNPSSGEVEYIWFEPDEDGTLVVTSDFDEDMYGWLFERASRPSISDVPSSDDADELYSTSTTGYLDRDDDGAGDLQFELSADVYAGETYLICVSALSYNTDPDPGTIYLDFTPVDTGYTSWQTPVNIVNLSGSSYTTYSATSTVNCYNAGRVRYLTPNYAGKLVMQTTSKSTSPDYYSHLAKNTLSTGTGTSRFTAVIADDYTDSDDDGAAEGYDTLTTYYCDASTYYYWYVNAKFVKSGTYSIPWRLDYYRKYTFSYNLNGGTGSTHSAVDFYADNTTMTVTTNIPTKSGYTFLGWSTSSTATSASYTGGNTYTFPAQNIILYAVWRQNTITVTYNANGGSGAPSAQTFYQYISSAISSTIPTRAGYSFLGWSTSSTATSATYIAGNSYSFASSTTLYAVWQLNAYTVTYNTNGGTGTFPAQNFNADNKSITIYSNIPVKTGYTFLGWGTSATTTTVSYNAGSTYTLSLQNYTLYAIWRVKTYTISYNANGGSGTVASQTKTYGTNLTLANGGFTSTGFTLSHWNTRANGTGLSYALGSTYIDVGEVNVTLYAIWSNNTYSLIYNTNGGDGGPGVDAKPYGRKWEINVVTAPIREGYTFKGWAETNAAITPLYKTKTFPAAEIDVTLSNKTLYAVWWPHFMWGAQTKEYANQLVDYIKTYIGKTVSKITTTTSLLYLTEWYNEVATALGIDTLPENTIIQETHLQDLANAFNSY